MSVSIEIKGNLAKLLATEDLIIEHKAVETAEFNVKTRVLVLPVWDKASEFVYDMLVAHEVGHALFTPKREWFYEPEFKTVPFDYVNVVEDARIERLIKQRYRGLNRDFTKAYAELNNDDLFEIADKNVNWLKPIDRINLYFKIGNFIDIEFNDIENEFVSRISRSETFDEVLQISKDIHEYTKEVQEEMQSQIAMNPNASEASDNGEVQKVEIRPDMSQSKDDAETGNSVDDTDNQGEDTTEASNNESSISEENDDNKDGDAPEFSNTQGGEFGNIDTSNTQRSIDNNLEDLTNTYKDQIPTTYVTVPEILSEKVVIEFDKIKSYLDNHFIEHNTNDNNQAFIDEHTKTFREFKKSSNKEVNYLVKEFEMKKSADSYSRQATAKTGMLDTSKLHTYMYNEDIFKKVTTIPEGKNHGLVFILDWSGSMNSILPDTLKQLFQLVWFCKKVQIPYEVYAFTNDSWMLDPANANAEYDDYRRRSGISDQLLVKEWRENDIQVDGTFRMVNILSSKQRSKDVDSMMLNLWMTCESFSYRNHGLYFSHPRKFTLSGTPLNEAIIASKSLVNDLIKTSGVQKCHVIMLTDGEAHHPSYNVDRSKLHHDFDLDHKGSKSVHSQCMLRNKRTSKTYSLSHSNATQRLIECVKDDLPNVSFIAFRIVERGGLRYVYNQYGFDTYDTYEQMKEEIKKGNLSLTMRSFDKFFMIPQQHLHVDSDVLDQVQEGSAKKDVSRAFRKMFKNKKTNKFMLSEFAKQIA